MQSTNCPNFYYPAVGGRGGAHSPLFWWEPHPPIDIESQYHLMLSYIVI